MKLWVGRLEIDWMGRPISANAWYGKHHFPKAALVAEWNGAAIQAARIARFPKGLAGFKGAIQFRYRNGQLTDADSAAPTWKAICDGLITYGLAPDDTAEFFGGVTLLPPYFDSDLPNAVIVTITELTPEETSCPPRL